MKSQLFLIATMACASALAAAEPARIESAAGVTAELDGMTGHYTLRVAASRWSFAGDLGGPAGELAVSRGADRLGTFQEIDFEWMPARMLAGTIRLYDAQPAVLFSLVCRKAGERLPALLPRFTSVPRDLHRFSYRDRPFSPPSFALERNGTPWLLFDDQAHAVVISPAANFMSARMTGDGVQEIACGLNDGVASLPAGFTHRTLLFFANGINAAWDGWGSALTALEGRTRPANDADIGLRYLGYWTDNGAHYYYHYDDPALGYAGTLEALVKHFREQGIPMRYLQLDSWWYYKTLVDPDGRVGEGKNRDLPEGEWNRYGGVLKYVAHPAVLPEGLAAFARKIGLPLITHNRWLDPASPYFKGYQLSGVAAVDPRWWNDTIGYLAGAGVVCYEQDWLNVIYDHSPAFATVPGVGEAFTDNMARAARERGLDLQYCMASPRYFLQGSRYDNLTTIRVSDDRFARERWDSFLYTSRLAAAVGVWPWADVFMSGERDNLLLATLSAGMVGTGDPIGAENKDNLLKAARVDGVIVKPDTVLLPIDTMYASDAAAPGRSPMIAATRTDHGALRTVYLFAYNRDVSCREGTFSPAALGFAGDVVVLNVREQTVAHQAASSPVRFESNPGATAFYEVVPLGRSGIAFFGDAGKFVSNGAKRIAALDDTPDGLTATVTFAAGERSVRLFGYAPRAPRARAVRGAAGAVGFDAASGRFEVDVSPAPEITREAPGGDPVQQARVQLSEPASP
jgi:hypothetical protein